MGCDPMKIVRKTRITVSSRITIMLSPENELCNILTRNHEAKRLKRTLYAIVTKTIVEREVRLFIHQYDAARIRIIAMAAYQPLERIYN